MVLFPPFQRGARGDFMTGVGAVASSIKGEADGRRDYKCREANKQGNEECVVNMANFDQR